MSRWSEYRALRRELEDTVSEIVNDNSLHTCERGTHPQSEDEDREHFEAGNETIVHHSATNETESELSWDELSDDVEAEHCEGHEENYEDSVLMRLARLSLKHNLTHACVKDIAALLRSCGHDIPADARTILGTQRRAPLQHDGTFAHFGLETGILECIQMGVLPSEIRLQANIDGLPLYKSSSTCFWPILCRVANHGYQEPFLVSLYCGKGKPPNLDTFLTPFLEEVQHLMTEGIQFKGTHMGVKLDAVICDAVARSFLKRIKSHNGYYGCERCVQKGTHQENRMLFLELDAPLHTNESFREQHCKHHHTGESPFLCLDVDIVALFPLDYMHLLCLGVMRRLLVIWIGGKYGRGKLSGEQQRTLSGRLNSYRKDFPNVFQRKPRGVEEIERWKATEFRSFLLYAGPVALRKVLPDKLYEHFLILHVASRILAAPALYRNHNDYVQKLLQYFVQGMEDLYGTVQLIYNVHSLVHLAGDCMRHGPLDSFSAFPFECFLGKLKRMLRTTSSPLSQISRRVSEIKHSTASRPEKAGAVHKVKPGSSYFLENGSIARVQEVRASQVRVTVFSTRRDFFVTPIESSFLNIFRVSNGNSHSERTMPLAAFTKDMQCVLLSYRSDYVAFPLLHHERAA